MRHRTIGGGSSFMRQKFALALSRMYSWQWVNVSWVLCYSTNFSLYGEYSSPNETQQVFMFSVLNTLCRKLSKFCPFLEDQKILTSYIFMSRVSRTYPDIIFESFAMVIYLCFQIHFLQSTIVKSSQNWLKCSKRVQFYWTFCRVYLRITFVSAFGSDCEFDAWMWRWYSWIY